MPTIDELEAQARMLSLEDQLELGNRLLSAMIPHPFEKEWIEECESRSSALKAGKMSTISRKEMNERLSRRR